MGKWALGFIVLCVNSSGYAASISFGEFQTVATQTAADMERFHDQDAYCGFFAYSDAQGITLIVNSSDEQSNTVFIPKGAELALTVSPGSTLGSSARSYRYGHSQLKVIRTDSEQYHFIAVMLNDGNQTVNCAVTTSF